MRSYKRPLRAKQPRAKKAASSRTSCGVIEGTMFLPALCRYNVDQVISVSMGRGVGYGRGAVYHILPSPPV